MTKQQHDFGVRPKCAKCDNDCQWMGTYKKDGSPIYRKLCGTCHQKGIAEKRGVKNITEVIAQNKGMTVGEYQLYIAKTNGFDSYNGYLNSKHPYRKHRKDYCENGKGEFAGWLGFKCTTTIVAPHLQLDTDHLDGNSDNNDEENLMTLCKCCHSIKGNMFMDYSTPGRKKRRAANLHQANT